MSKEAVERTWKHYEERACKRWVMRPKLNVVRLPMTHQQLLENIQKNDGTSLGDAEMQITAFEQSFRDNQD